MVNEHLRHHTKNVYFYCDFGDEANTTSFRSIVGSILAQLLYQAPEVSGKALLCNMLFEKQRTGLPISNATDELTVMVIMACRLFEELTIVIDGLDEYPKHTRGEIISCFIDHDILTGPKKGAKIYFSSRDESDIRQLLARVSERGYDFHSISLSNPTEGQHLQNDIQAYISTRVRNMTHGEDPG